MHRLFRSALWLGAAVLLALGFSVAEAAERNIALFPGNDRPRFDYPVIKGSTVDACMASRHATDRGIPKGFQRNRSAR